MFQCLFWWKFEPSKMPNVNIHYSDGGKNVAQSVNYDSWFLQSPNAVNLKEKI